MELLVNYAQMVMEASGEEVEDKRQFYAQLAGDLLMDNEDVEVELQRTRTGPRIRFRRGRGTIVGILGLRAFL